MAENTQEIRFGATTKELTEAVDGVKRQLESLKEFGEGLGDQLKELFAIREIVEFVKSMGELGEQTERVSLQLGISTEAVGELSGLALLTGTNIDSLALSIERMYLNVQRAARDGFNPGAQALKVLGLSAKDLIGLNADKYLEKLTEAASKFAPSLNLTTALMAIGGRGAAQMVAALIEGKRTMEIFGAAISDTGSKLKQNIVDGMVDTNRGMILFGLSMKGLGATVFTGFKGAIDGIVLAFTDLVQWFRRAISEGGSLEGVFKALTGTANTLAAALQSIVSLFEALMAIASFKVGLGTNFRDEATRVSKELEDIGNKWKASMGKIFGGGAHGEHDEGEKENAKEMDDALRERLRRQQEALEAQIKLIDLQYKYTTERLNTGVAVFTITEQQKVEAQKRALNERDDGEKAILEKVLALWKEGTTEYQKIQERLFFLSKDRTEKQKKLDDELLKKEVKDWNEDLGMIQRAWDSQLSGLLAHTTSWATAMKKIAGDLVLEIIKMFEKLVLIRPLAAALEQSFGAINLTPLLEKIGTIAAEYMATAFTGLVSFFAPMLGPAALPAAAGITAAIPAAAAAAAVIPGAEVGAWNVPATSPWLLHRGETVLPSRAADAFRNLASGSGLGGSTANFNITAMDGSDVLRVLNRHAGTFARVLQGHMAANPNSHR